MNNNIDLKYTSTEDVKDVSKLYWELIYAVGIKHPNETRHETALRYIRDAERISGIPSMNIAETTQE